MRCRRRREKVDNYLFYPPEKGQSFHRPEKGETCHRPEKGETFHHPEKWDRFHRLEKGEASFSFMGLRYFPQLETAMREANFQKKGLAALTILETDDSLPHLLEDWSHPYSDWPFLLDASSFKVIRLSSISPRNFQCFLGFDMISERQPRPTVWIG